MSGALEQFHETMRQLYAMVDTNPAEAVRIARTILGTSSLPEDEARGLAGCVLVDAGKGLRDAGVVADGTEVLRGLVESAPNRADLQYSLANGLVASADLVPYEDVTWFTDTGDTRRDARSFYASAARTIESHEIRGRCLTNLGNALLRAYRFVEAYDSYLDALRFDPTNAVASTGAAKVLLRFVDMGIGDKDILLDAAAQHIRRANADQERLKELAGPRAFQELAELLSRDISGRQVPDLDSADEYTRFVARHRLALSPTIEGLDPSVPRWDSLAFTSIIEPPGDDSGVPPIFALFNVLKSDYLAARHLAYVGSSGDVPETGTYYDTLDHAIYGVGPSLLTLSQRACFDVLDKVAAAASQYLSLPGKTSRVKFTNRWFDKNGDGQPTWQPAVLEEIRSGNAPLIALCEVSRDTQEDGFLHPKRKMRSTGTHRFAVLHDLGTNPSRRCRFATHYGLDEYRQSLVDTLQLTRAVLFYFYETILAREWRLSRKAEPRAHLLVPDYDWVRGRDVLGTASE